MKFRVTYIPSFEAAVSEVDPTSDFSEKGKLGTFDKYFSTLHPSQRDSFMTRDFLYYDEQKQGMIWMYALTNELDDGGFETIRFEGGYYVSYFYNDGDDDVNAALYKEALEYINSSKILELDVRENHYAMGHIITPQEISDAHGWSQMETYIPVKLMK